MDKNKDDFKELNPFVQSLGSKIYYKRFNYKCSDNQKKQYFRMFKLHNPANFIKGDYSDTNAEKTTLKNYNRIQRAINFYFNTYPDIWNHEVEELLRLTLETYNYRVGILHRTGSLPDIILALILIYNRNIPAGFFRRKHCKISKQFVDRVEINLQKSYKPNLTRIPYDMLYTSPENNQILDGDTYVPVDDY